jgi:hypothetical protein
MFNRSELGHFACGIRAINCSCYTWLKVTLPLCQSTAAQSVPSDDNYKTVIQIPKMRRNCPVFFTQQLSLFYFLFYFLRAPQQMLRTHRKPWGLLCNPMVKMFFFLFFRLMEHQWNEIDRGKPKYSGENLSQCHFVHNKSRMYWPGIEPGPPRWEAGD